MQFFSWLNQALTIDLTTWFSDAWEDVTGRYTLVIHSDAVDDYSPADLDALHRAGLSEQDIYDVTHPHTQPISQNSSQLPGGSHFASDYIAVSDEKPKPDSGAESSLPSANGYGGEPIIIPAFPDEMTRIDYELTYYLNDVSREHVQVAAEFGKRGETKSVYTYGL